MPALVFSLVFGFLAFGAVFGLKPALIIGPLLLVVVLLKPAKTVKPKTLKPCAKSLKLVLLGLVLVT